MARRRGRRSGTGPNRADRPGARKYSKRQPMLNLGNLDVFRYDLRNILRDTDIDPETMASIVAQIIAKASRISIESANLFLETLVEREEITGEIAEAISRLLDRNTRYR